MIYRLGHRDGMIIDHERNQQLRLTVRGLLRSKRWSTARLASHAEWPMNHRHTDHWLAHVIVCRQNLCDQIDECLNALRLRDD